MMQRREHERYHSAWSIPFYGGPADKEAYRRHYRDVLQRQMTDLSQRNRAEFQAKFLESEAAIEYDRHCMRKDLEDFVNKLSYMKRFRDHNKTFMEDTWQLSRMNKARVDAQDREVMRFNPINWSGTLS